MIGADPSEGDVQRTRARLRLGVFETFDTPNPVEPGSVAGSLSRAVELGVLAEHLGYDAFWVAEHHFRPGASLPAPPVLLAALAARTRRIRIGPLVAVLPLHEPVLLAEEYALLDALSGGRLDVGVGPGYVREEFEALGVSVGDRSREFEAALARFLRALAGDPGSSPPNPAWELGIPVTQRPHPPVVRAAARAASIRQAALAGHGLGLIPYATLERFEQIHEPIAEYRASLAPGAPPRIVAAFHVYIGPHLGRAIEAAQRFLEGRPRAPDPGVGPAHVRDPRGADARTLWRRGLLLFGDEAEVGARLAWLASAGVTDLAAMVDFGGLPRDDVEGTLRALARCAPGPVGEAAAGPETSSPRSRAGEISAGRGLRIAAGALETSQE